MRNRERKRQKKRGDLFFPGLRRHSVDIFMVIYKKKAQSEANGNNLAVNPMGCHVIFLGSSGTSEKRSPLVY